MGVRGDDEAYVCRMRGRQIGVFDEVGVDNRVEKMVVDRVVNVRVLIVVNPVKLLPSVEARIRDAIDENPHQRVL